MNRFRLISLLALVAAIALVATGCGGDKKSSSSNVPPSQRVKTALQNVEKIDSGSMTMSGSLSGAGMPGKMSVSGDGKFDTKAEGGPAVEMKMKLDLGFGGQPQEVGLISVDGKSYIEFGGKFYSADSMMKGITGATGDSKPKSSTAIDSKQLKEMINSLSGMVGEVTASGTKQVGGEKVDVYTATIDVSKAVDEAKKQAGSALDGLSALGGVGDLGKIFGDTKILIGIDSNDLPRSIEIKSTVDPKAAGASGSGGTIEGSLILTEVNQPVTITKPAKVESGSGLLEALGAMFGGMGTGGMGMTGMGQ